MFRPSVVQNSHKTKPPHRLHLTGSLPWDSTELNCDSSHRQIFNSDSRGPDRNPHCEQVPRLPLKASALTSSIWPQTGQRPTIIASAPTQLAKKVSYCFFSFGETGLHRKLLI